MQRPLNWRVWVQWSGPAIAVMVGLVWLRALLGFGVGYSVETQLVFAIVLLAVGLLTPLAFSRRSAGDHGPPPFIVIERRALPAPAIAGVALATYILFLIVTPIAMDAVLSLVLGDGYVDRIARMFGVSDTVVLGACTALWFGIPYPFARAAYSLLRWRRVSAARATCGSCGYDLTGNVSGRCPECRRDIPIAGRVCES